MIVIDLRFYFVVYGGIYFVSWHSSCGGQNLSRLLTALSTMSYLDHKCKKCSNTFHYQVPRGFLLKNIFGFVPIKIYWCPYCKRERYVWVNRKKD